MRFSLLLLFASMGCLDTVDPPDSELGSITSEINGPDAPATPTMVAHAAALVRGSSAYVPFCSGTLVASGWVITARHCGVVGGSYQHAALYSAYTSFDTPVHDVSLVTNPAGTTTTDLVDDNGMYADFALVKLDSRVGAHPAQLAWVYPGAGAAGYKVGNGQHDGDPNPDGELRYVDSTTDSSDDADGSFMTTHWRTDGADSGGPFYVGGRILGINTGGQFDWDSGVYRGLYTSVPKHLKFILQSIGWMWAGQAPLANRATVGTFLQAFPQTQIGCQYACTNTPACVAYTHFTSLGQCHLYSTRTGTTATTNTTTAWK